LVLSGTLLLAAYLLGSIPTGYLVGRWILGIDIREHGSGSTGATNVLRILGKWPALVVVVVDMGKGATAIALVHWIYSYSAIAKLAPTSINLTIWPDWIATLAGLAALLGHSKSLWLNFTGGKSVATGLGVLFAMHWPVGLGTLAIFGLVLGIFRIVSLGSITGAIACSGLMLGLGQPLPYQLFAIAGGLYVIWRHRSNIERLMAGTEPRLGQSLPPNPEQISL
jgi:glycerol-3-phosphate acyltransferase PlsY